MKKLVFFFIFFICYIPAIGILSPKLYCDINLEWLFFYFLLIFFVVIHLISHDVRSGGILVFTVLFYSAIVFISVCWAENYTYDLHTLMRIFARVISPLIILFMAMNLFRYKENSNQYIKHIVFASFIISLINIYQMVLGGGYETDKFRASANFFNPNGVAIFLVLTLPCQLYAVGKKIISKKLGSVISIVVAAGIICTVSRKGIISMGLVYLMYYMYKKQIKKIIGLMLIGFVVAMGLSGYAFIDSRFNKKDLEKHYLGKHNMAGAGIEMFLASPLIGLGYRGYYENFGKYFPHAPQKKYSAHNIYITALANYGLIGFIPFMGIFVVPIVCSVKVLVQNNRKRENKYFNDMALICLLTTFVFMLCGFYAGGLFYNYKVMFILYTNMALFLAIHPNHSAR